MLARPGSGRGAPEPWPRAPSTAAAYARESAALSGSPVRMRITRSMSVTKTLPSPTLPVLADLRIASIA